MRILKNKVAKATMAQKRKDRILRLTKEQEEKKQLVLKIIQEENQAVKPGIRARPVRQAALNKAKETPVSVTSSKNIMKNYSRALTNFALSKFAQPYLEIILITYETEEEIFRKFIEERKEKVNCIKNLRELLLVEDGDSKEIAGAKKTFKDLCVVFMKFFSVNWVFQSKIDDKITHLKYRFKILRRVQNPACFTYLEDFSK